MKTILFAFKRFKEKEKLYYLLSRDLRKKKDKVRKNK